MNDPEELTVAPITWAPSDFSIGIDSPVIMLSSKDGIFDRARGRLAGSDRYLTKPFTKEGLLAAVSEYVS